MSYIRFLFSLSLLALSFNLGVNSHGSQPQPQSQPDSQFASNLTDGEANNQNSLNPLNSAETATVRLEQPGRGGMGSGSLISPAGLILTASHVVGRSRQITVQFQGQQLQGEVVKVAGGERSDVDYALVQIRSEQNNQFPFFQRCTESPQTGSAISVLGFPLGTHTLVKRSGSVLSQTGSPKANQFVIKADVKPGNSGGPLLDAEGRLCGVVTANIGQPGAAGVQRIDSVEEFLADVNR
jgi:serine protease Do